MEKINRMNYGLWISSLLVLPFVQGGYFNYSTMMFGLIQCLVLLVFVVQGRVIIKLDSMRFLMMGIALASILATYGAVDLGMQPYGVLRLIIPLLSVIIYDSFNAIYIHKLDKDLRKVYKFVAVLMAVFILCILTVFEYGHPVTSFFIQKNRFGGFFQYANTFAIFIFGVIVMVISEQRKSRYDIATIFLLSILVSLSQSRTVFIILSIYCILLLLSRQYQKICLVIVLGMLSGYIVLRWALPDFQHMRTLEIHLGVGEFQSRLLYYEDGLRMILNRLTGYGYLGYYYAQRFYQTGSTYYVRFIHSSILQATLDYGIIAGVIFIGQLALLIAKVYKNFRAHHLEKTLAFIGLTGYYIHAFIDFDNQFLAYLIFFYFFYYMINNDYEDVIKYKMIVCSRVNKLIGLIIVICGLAYGYFFLPAFYEYRGDYEQALNIYSKYTEAMTGVLEDVAKAPSQEQEYWLVPVTQFVDQNTYYYEGFAFLREYYYNNGDLEKSLFYSHKCKSLAPLWIQNYERHVDIAYMLLHTRYEADELSKKDPLFRELFTVEATLKELKEERENSYQVSYKARFNLTPKMTRKIAMAYRLYDKVME